MVIVNTFFLLKYRKLGNGWSLAFKMSKTTSRGIQRPSANGGNERIVRRRPEDDRSNGTRNILNARNERASLEKRGSIFTVDQNTFKMNSQNPPAPSRANNVRPVNESNTVRKNPTNDYFGKTASGRIVFNPNTKTPISIVHSQNVNDSIEPSSVSEDDGGNRGENITTQSISKEQRATEKEPDRDESNNVIRVRITDSSNDTENVSGTGETQPMTQNMTEEREIFRTPEQSQAYDHEGNVGHEENDLGSNSKDRNENNTQENMEVETSTQHPTEPEPTQKKKGKKNTKKNTKTYKTNNSIKKRTVKAVTISERAGLILPVPRIGNFAKMALGKDYKISILAKILFTAQIQYLLKNLTLSSQDAMKEIDPSRKTITKEDLNRAVFDDVLFSPFLHGLMISTNDMGVVNLPMTKKMKREMELLNKKRRAEKNRKNDSEKKEKKQREKNRRLQKN